MPVRLPAESPLLKIEEIRIQLFESEVMMYVYVVKIGANGEAIERRILEIDNPGPKLLARAPGIASIKNDLYTWLANKTGGTVE
jgi:hypothetical protein